MKNKEKFADILIDLLIENEKVAINIKTGKPCSCIGFDCSDCLRDECGCTGESLREWLDEEYEPKVDWSKVPVDTPVYVRNDVIQGWLPRHFAWCKNGKIYVWKVGKTSFTADGEEVVCYLQTELAKEEENGTN